MRTLLIFPPQGHFTQPYLALPSLQAYMKQEGFPDTHVMDANIEAYDWLLEPQQLRRALEALRASDLLQSLEASDSLDFTQMMQYRALTQAELVGDWVVEEIESAKQVMRDGEQFYDRDAYTRAARIMEHGMAIISAKYFPTHFSAHGFSMRHSLQRTDDLIAGAQDEAGNPFLDFFREVTMPKIKELDPDLIGMSMTFGSQAIPSLALAAMIKEWKPEVHITVGGGLLAYVGHKLAKRPEVFDLIDTMVLLEGERPLVRIAEAVRDGKDLYGIENVIHRDVDGMVHIAPEADPLRIDELPAPDFSGLPLERYFSPEFIVPLAITRGCYWGKCVFCTLHEVIGPGYRGRSIDKVIEDIRMLSEKHGAKRFYFPIEDLPPNMVRKLPRAILDAGLEIEWWCDAKLEPEVFTDEVCRELAESGCKRLAFGYESASKRVLDLMCKGSDPVEGMDVIKRVRKAGISVTLYVMVGFPTETEEEAQLTLETLMANIDLIEEVSMRVFYLDYKSEVFKQAAKFGIDEVYHEEGADLQVYYDFHSTVGMSRLEARRKYLEMLKLVKSNLPVFHNQNLLYHELKSHYFLYLAKEGSVERLLEGPFAPVIPPTLEDSMKLRLASGLRFLESHFDRDVVDAAMERATDKLTLPRYQFDLITGKELEEMQGSNPSVPAQPSVLVLQEGTGEIACLAPASRDFLQTLDGTHTCAEILSGLPEAHRADAHDFLEQTLQFGLLTTPEGINDDRQESKEGRRSKTAGTV